MNSITNTVALAALTEVGVMSIEELIEAGLLSGMVKSEQVDEVVLGSLVLSSLLTKLETLA